MGSDASTVGSEELINLLEVEFLSPFFPIKTSKKRKKPNLSTNGSKDVDKIDIICRPIKAKQNARNRMSGIISV